MRSERSCVAAAVAAVVASFFPASSALAASPTSPRAYNYSILNNVRLHSYVAQPVNSPPINGFVPRVVFGLTNEFNEDSFLNEGLEDQLTAGVEPPGGFSWLPNGTPGEKYLVATVDSGAQTHVITLDDSPEFDFDGNDMLTSNFSELQGAGGITTATITKALGTYMTGFANATGGANIGVSGTVKGHYHMAILSADDADSIPFNVIGSPILSQYQVAITNSNPRTLQHGATTYHSPQVTLTSLTANQPLPSDFYRMSLEVLGPNGAPPFPAFIADLDLGSSEFVPSTPSFWANLFGNVNGGDAGNTSTNKQFLIDTGAQVTVFSQETAAEYGYYSGGPEPSTPEFTVEVSGVGGIVQVPGFYVDSLNVMTNGGPVTWHNVPVLVFDLPDLRDGIGYIPGILGMNLFTDRDLVLQGGLENPALAFSAQFQWWTNGGGSWSENAKWMRGTPDSAEHPAQFLGRITSPQTVTVDGNYTVGNLTFDNVNRYTIGGSGRLTLQTNENPTVIGVYSGSHTINAPMTFASDTIINVAPPASKLTITSDVIASGIDITKTGLGTVEMKNVRADALALDGGVVVILPSGTNAATSVLKSISATTGQMDLQNNKLVVRGTAGGGTGTLGTWNGAAYSGITGLVADDHLITTQSSASGPQKRTSLAVATADQIGRVGQTFGGQTVGTGDVLVMYTYVGDADLSGEVDADDFFRIDAGFTGGLKGYFNGDFDYSGTIDADDYFLIDSSYAFHGSPIASAVSAVPEPAGLPLILAAFAMTARRRRV